MDTRKIGHVEQVAFVRPVKYTDGRANGLEAYQLHNGKLDFSVLKSRCLDIGDMRFKGTNVGFLSKTGLMAPQIYDVDCMMNIQAGLMGGFLFTCGLSNVGAKCEVDGEWFPFHGQIRSTAAEGCSHGTYLEGDRIKLFVEGTTKEAVLQSRDLSLKRRVETEYMSSSFEITDVITNNGYCEEPLLLTYHINYGWPLLDECARVELPVTEERSCEVGAPKNVVGEESVFAFEPAADAAGKVVCRIINEKIGMGASLTYDKKALPRLGEWRSEAAGDYVVGIEPGLCGVEGRKAVLESGKAKLLAPKEQHTVKLKFEFFEL